jgi:hypothetical protein
MPPSGTADARVDVPRFRAILGDEQGGRRITPTCKTVCRVMFDEILARRGMNGGDSS